VAPQLNGLVHTHDAVVTWAGLTTSARKTMKLQRFRVRIGESEDVVEAVLHNYETLPEESTERLPPRRAWMLKDA